MPRDPLPYVADDVSALAKSLRRQLGDHLETHRSLPSHVQLLQMLARAGGHRNHQSLRAAARRPGADAAPSPAVSDPPASPVTAAPSATAAASDGATDRRSGSTGLRPRPTPQAHARGSAAREQLPPQRGPRDPSLSTATDRALRQFDEAGRLMRWPSRYATQRLALWGLWARFDPERRYREAEVNAVLNDLHLFGDHCTLRRELVNMKLLWRSDGGAEYRRVPAEPDAEARALLGRLAGRRAAG